MNKLSLYKNQKWIAAVSGGPDSMALLDMAFKSGVDLTVLHVNYHKRDTAIRDQKIVQEYCNTNNISCYVYDAGELKGNFQDQARIFRYTKLKEVVQNIGAMGVLVAHHKDDDLETLVFQIQRKSKVTTYGLADSTQIFGIRVDRPLLNYTKNELIEYCNKQNVSFGIDESNESLVYTRNKIRKLVANLSSNEVDELFRIKEEYNQARVNLLEQYKDLLNQTSISHNIYISLIDNRHSFLLEWLRKQTNMRTISDKFITELDRQLVNSKSIKLRVSSHYRVIKQYELIQIVKDEEDYCYKLEIDEILDKQVKLKYQMEDNYLKVSISRRSFPITITNLRASKSQLQSNIYTKLSRWFIKNKIPVQEREMWPLVFNKQNELIYILNVGYEHGVSTDTIDCYMLK